MKDRLGRPTTAKREANKAYYLRNRERILAKAKDRYDRRVSEAKKVAAEVPVESPAVSTEVKKPQSRLSQWFQRFTGKSPA